MKKFKLAVYFLLVLFEVGASINSAHANSADKCELFFKKLKLCAQITWTILPKQVELISENDKAEFILKFSTKGKPQREKDPNTDVVVKLFMPSMGHGSRPTLVLREKDVSGNLLPGQYRVRDVYFTMTGDWEIQVELRNKGKLRDRATVRYKL